ncbi:MAG TPA: phosphatidylglycerophosphatase A [Oligoflexia bacterium]|nr:phosphatidylglycerophosphatase A [Oligoflexia bacterium]HMP48249.1 phosphatidylglycerophosphatase A [Oligoflexia bacterium]
MTSYRTICHIIATGFGSGLSRKAPGTCGTIAALLFALAYLDFIGPPDTYIRLGIAFFVTLISFPVINTILESYSEETRKDPQEIVIDEFAGFFVAAFFVEWSFTSLLLALIFFRAFDISKIGVIKYFEKLPGAIGIVLDDVAAGLHAGIILFVLYQLLPS